MCCVIVMLLAAFPFHVPSSDTSLGVRMRHLYAMFCCIQLTLQAVVGATGMPKAVLCLQVGMVLSV